MTETDHESDTDRQTEETETETDRLFKQLDALKKQLKEIKITASGAASNLNYVKFNSANNHPIISLNIPNSLFLLWSKRNKIESKLGSAKTPMINLVAESIGKFISLNAASATLIQRLRNKQSRFLANYRKSVGAKQKKLLKQCTNMILLQEEVIPLDRLQVTASYIASSVLAIYS